MKQSEIVKKIEAFLEKEFGVFGLIEISPTFEREISGKTTIIENDITIRFRIQ